MSGPEETETRKHGAMAELNFEVPESAAGQRLDAWLPEALDRAGETASRSAVQRWIKDGAVTVNGARVKARHTLAAGERIAARPPEPESAVPQPEAMDLSVLHEDEDLIVIDKPAGLVVHPGAGNRSGTLVNGLLHHCGGKLSRLADEDRPGIVHRLDKETSGCLVAAKSDRAYESLVAQFSGRETRKIYLAVVAGVPAAEQGRIENRIGRHPVQRQRMAVRPEPEGKEAVTEYRVIAGGAERGWSTLECRIFTGRTHQIRVHLKESLGCPILGDPIYGRRGKKRRSKPAPPEVSRLMLHACRLEFRHPGSGEEMEFEANVPAEFEGFVREEL